MPPPLISVIIPTFNRKEKTGRAIDSVLHQTLSSLECIVVDDGSGDGTFEYLEKRFQNRIRLFRQDNRGVSAARNKGIMEAKGNLIAFLDSDDVWMEEKLSRQLGFLREHPDLFLCQTTEIWFRKGKKVNPRSLYRKKDGNFFESSLSCCMITPSSVVIKKKLLEETGLFDEALPVCEDYDLWLRVTWKYPVGLIEEDLLIRYGGEPDQLSARHSRDQYRIQALEKLLKSGVLNTLQRMQALRTFREKCRIYGNGCIKRGRQEEGEHYLCLGNEFEKWKDHG